MSEGAVMEHWVIYDHPSDHPEHWVVRRWFVGAGQTWPSPVVHRYDDLESAREAVAEKYPSGHRLDRQPDDDPSIVEVWI